jgi:hypothetical protein
LSSTARDNSGGTNDDENADEDDEEINMFDDSEDIEALIARSNREVDEKKRAEKVAAIQKKKEVLKRRADKEYEAYWDRKNGELSCVQLS